MKRIAMILPTAALLCLAAASRVGDALAQPQRLTFKVEQANARYTQQHTIDVGDVPGHQVRVFEVRRTYPSNPPVINGVKIVESWTRGISDYTDNNGPAVVYHVYVGENGDKFFVTSSAISVQAPGTRTMTITTVGTVSGGTGEFFGIQGLLRLSISADVQAGRANRRSNSSTGFHASMIVLFTDFGLQGPYTGQMKAVLHQMAPGISIIDLFADAPAGNPKASAYLLAAYAQWFAAGTTFLCVVDPGVGGTRPPVILEADGRWYVGPGNGLFELVERRAMRARSFEIEWRPENLSASFHGRDLFAPVAAMIARGEPPPGRPRAERRANWPDDLAEIVYVDHFGNAMTGLRASMLAEKARLAVAGRALDRATTFSDRPPGAAFWYENSNGLAEIAVNRGRADRDLGLVIGSPVEIVI